MFRGLVAKSLLTYHLERSGKNCAGPVPSITAQPQLGSRGAVPSKELSLVIKRIILIIFTVWISGYLYANCDRLESIFLQLLLSAGRLRS